MVHEPTSRSFELEDRADGRPKKTHEDALQECRKRLERDRSEQSRDWNSSKSESRGTAT